MLNISNENTLTLLACNFKFFSSFSIYKAAASLYNILTVIKIKHRQDEKSMDRTFPETLSALRRARNISQRQAAAELQISQALLSHYENGAREPGLSFVCRVCDYYGVSADYLLGRSEIPNPAACSAKDAGAFLGELQALLDRAQGKMREFSIEEEQL